MDERRKLHLYVCVCVRGCVRTDGRTNGRAGKEPENKKSRRKRVYSVQRTACSVQWRLVGAYINVILYIADVRLILASRPPARNTSKDSV